MDTDPLQILKEKFLSPLGLSHSDTAKATHTHIADTSKNKTKRKFHKNLHTQLNFINYLQVFSLLHPQLWLVLL